MALKLVAFSVPDTTQSVYINPEHVVAVLPNTVGTSVVVLVSDRTYYVKGDQDDVAQALMTAGAWSSKG
jgi:hypothetical protein